MNFQLSQIYILVVYAKIGKNERNVHVLKVSPHYNLSFSKFEKKRKSVDLFKICTQILEQCTGMAIELQTYLGLTLKEAEKKFINFLLHRSISLLGAEYCILMLLLLLSGDVELNPGPEYEKQGK
jgi:hypothetical protein